MKQVSAEWFRQQQSIQNGIIPIRSSDAPMLADALEIADEGARSDIELHAPCARWVSPRHYDLARVDPIFKRYTDKAARYLEARGLLERLPEERQIVCVLDVEKAMLNTRR